MIRKYKERYERDVEAGRKFAKATRIDKAGSQGAGLCQRAPYSFSGHRVRFRKGGLAWNIYRITVVYRHQPAERTATEMQDSVLEGAAQDVAGRGTEGNRDREIQTVAKQTCHEKDI